MVCKSFFGSFGLLLTKDQLIVQIKQRSNLDGRVELIIIWAYKIVEADV